MSHGMMYTLLSALLTALWSWSIYLMVKAKRQYEMASRELENMHLHKSIDVDVINTALTNQEKELRTLIDMLSLTKDLK